METHSLETGLMALAAFAVVMLANDRTCSQFVSSDISRYKRIISNHTATWQDKIEWWYDWLFFSFLFWIMLWGINFLAAVCSSVILNSKVFSIFYGEEGWISSILKLAVILGLGFLIVIPHLEKVHTLSKNLGKERVPTFLGLYSATVLMFFIDVSPIRFTLLLLVSYILLASATIDLSQRIEAALKVITIFIITTVLLVQLLVPERLAWF